MRNLLYAIGNSGLPELRSIAAEHVNDADPTLAEAARWAVQRLDVSGK